MAILIDPPRWPAHGTLFSHLVSDQSLDELHHFAAAAGVPPRAFDHDHYDVAQRRYDDLIARGAQPVSGTELVRRLLASGLRTRTPERTPKVAQVLPGLRDRWARLMPGHDALGADLLHRWTAPGRHYHDARHLAQCLDALDQLTDQVPRTVALAAWFHDAVYEGRPGADEEASAELAESTLPAVGVSPEETDEVARLVRLTIGHRPDRGDHHGALLTDADLSILGQSPGRYHVYVRDVRLDYEHVDDETFRLGRLAVIDHLLGLEPLFHTHVGNDLWADLARANLLAERQRWLASAPITDS